MLNPSQVIEMPRLTAFHARSSECTEAAFMSLFMSQEEGKASFKTSAGKKNQLNLIAGTGKPDCWNCSLTREAIRGSSQQKHLKFSINFHSDK